MVLKPVVLALAEGSPCSCGSEQVWLKQPLVNLEEIRERHDIVEAFAEDPTLRERLRNLHLRGVLHLSISAMAQGMVLHNFRQHVPELVCFMQLGQGCANAWSPDVTELTLMRFPRVVTALCSIG